MATALLALVGAAAAQQIAWPVRGAIGQTWTVNLQGIGTWTLNLTQAGSGGAPVGRATGPDQRVGYFEYIAAQGQSADFGVLWLDVSQTDSYGCVFSRSGIQGNTISGRSARDQNGNITNLNAACTATLASANAQTPNPPPVQTQPAPSSTANLTWPPTLAVGQQYTASIAGVNTWNVTLNAQNGTAYSGSAVPVNGAASLQASFFYRPDVDTAELDLTDGTQLYACIFTARGSIQNGALRGAAYLRTSPSAAFTNLNAPCEVRPVASSAQVGPAPVGPAPVGPAPTPPAPPPAAQALTYPVAFAVGQTWSGTFQAGTWTARFTELDGDGDPRGLTTSGPDRRTAGGFTDSGDSIFYVFNNTEAIYCVGSRNGLNGSTVSGQAQRFSPPNAQQGTAAGPCSFTLQAGATTTQGSSGGAAVAAALSWPPAFAVGQTWSATFQSGTWLVTFTERDGDGDPRGLTTSGPDRRTAGGFMLSPTQATLYTLTQNEVLRCVAERSGLSGNTLVGVAQRISPPTQNSPIQQAGPCSFTLQGGAPGATAVSSPGTAPASNNAASSALSWPPAFAVGQTWSGTFQAGTWTARFTELDSDGDPRGLTTSGPDRRTAGAFMDGANAIFYVLSSSENLVCLTTRNGLSGATLTGQAARFSPPNAQQASAAGPCSFTLQPQTLSTRSALETWLKPLPLGVVLSKQLR
jgi:hypothetical protein